MHSVTKTKTVRRRLALAGGIEKAIEIRNMTRYVGISHQMHSCHHSATKGNFGMQRGARRRLAYSQLEGAEARGVQAKQLQGFNL